jgi:hypothetical protein
VRFGCVLRPGLGGIGPPRLSGGRRGCETEMSDTWSSIQAHKKQLDSLRERLQRRRKQDSGHLGEARGGRAKARPGREGTVPGEKGSSESAPSPSLAP